MTEFADYVGEHVRLTALRLMEGQATYCANDSVLTQASQSMGVGCTRDQMRGHLQWLSDQGLVTLLKPMPDVIVATLTQRGLDVATGRSLYAGVARPSPKG
jgi:hypothetical protein